METQLQKDPFAEVFISRVRSQIIPVIKELMTAYSYIGFRVPFDSDVLDDLLLNGHERFAKRFEAMIRKDLEGNSYALEQALLSMGDHYRPFEDAYYKLIDLVRELPEGSYRLSGADFTIRGNHVELNTAAIIEGYKLGYQLI